MRDLVRNADILAQLAPLLDRAQAGRISAADAARAYAQIQELRGLADKYERDLIRSLRWDAHEKDEDGRPKVVRTWAQVAEVVDAQLGSRQAAHARWGQLKSPTRGEKRGRPRSETRPRT